VLDLLFSFRKKRQLSPLFNRGERLLRSSRRSGQHQTALSPFGPKSLEIGLALLIIPQCVHQKPGRAAWPESAEEISGCSRSAIFSHIRGTAPPESQFCRHPPGSSSDHRVALVISTVNASHLPGCSSRGIGNEWIHTTCGSVMGFPISSFAARSLIVEIWNGTSGKSFILFAARDSSDPRHHPTRLLKGRLPIQI
jgi:hypothetical protein